MRRVRMLIQKNVRKKRRMRTHFMVDLRVGGVFHEYAFVHKIEQRRINRRTIRPIRRTSDRVGRRININNLTT